MTLDPMAQDMEADKALWNALESRRWWRQSRNVWFTMPRRWWKPWGETWT